MNKQPITELFLDNVDVLPLWVKQVLYLQTKNKLKESLQDFLEMLTVDNLIQYYIPRLTFAGKEEFNTRAKRLTEEFYTFFKAALEGYSLFEITLANYWTFKQTCFVFVRSLEMQLVSLPEEENMVSVAQFIAGSIRTGEMLKRLGKITSVELDKALRLQRVKQESGENAKIAEILIQMGCISEDDVKILLAFKEEATKRFVMGIGFTFVKPRNEDEAQTLVRGMQKEIKRLSEENTILKTRLKKILNIKG